MPSMGKITDVEKFLTKAKERFVLAQRAEDAWRPDCLDDWKFSSGEQWPQDIRTARVQDGRPCLTMNRFPTIVSQITNDERQQRPAVNVNPVGDGADRETADVFQGIVRHIEVRSDAEISRDQAFEQMVTGGFGHYRLLTEYVDDTFMQEILIASIQNPFLVYTDPLAQSPDGLTRNTASLLLILRPSSSRTSIQRRIFPRFRVGSRLATARRDGIRMVACA